MSDRVSVPQKLKIWHWMTIIVVANSLVKAANAFVVLFFASILPPSAYALFGILFSLQGGMATFSVTGLVEVATGQLKRYARLSRTNLLFRKVAGLFPATTIISAAFVLPMLSMIAVGSESYIAILCAMVSGGLVGFSGLQANLLRLEERYLASLLSGAGVPVTGIAVLFLCGFSGLSQESTWAAVAIGMTAVIIALWRTNQIYCGFGCRWKKNLSMITSLLPFFILAVLGWLGGYGLNFIIDLNFTSESIALFTFLYTVSSVAQLLASSMNMAWTPRFYRLFNVGELSKAEVECGHFYKVLVVILGLSSCLVILMLPLVIEFIGGNLTNYKGHDMELGLLFTGYIFAIPWWHAQNYYLVTDLRQEYVSIVLVSSIVGLLIWIGAMLLLGNMGIFIGFTLQTAVKSIVLWGKGKKYWPMKPPWLLMAFFSIMIYLVAVR